MESKRFLFVSADAALVTDLAWQVHREGHDVKYYIEAESDQEIGDGFVPKTDDWRSDVEWADVVIFDDIWVGSDIGTGGLAEELRAEGKAVVGGRRTPTTSRRTAATRWRSWRTTASTPSNTTSSTTSARASSSSSNTPRRTSSNPWGGPERQASALRRQRGRRQRRGGRAAGLREGVGHRMKGSSSSGRSRASR